MTRTSRPERDVMVCRDCCCGSTRKHPDVEHERQQTVLEGAVGSGVRVRVVDCLDECERSNVVLVRDHSRPRRTRDTWLGGILDPRVTASLAAWVHEGGRLPAELASHVFARTRP